MAGAKILTDVIGDALRLAGKEAPEAASGIRAYHTTMQPFDRYDWSKLGSTTLENASGTSAENWASNLAKIGPWASEKPLGSRIGQLDLPVTIFGKTKEFGNLDELENAVRAAGGPEKFRETMTAQGFGNLKVADEEFGGQSFIALDPENFVINNDRAAGGRIAKGGAGAVLGDVTEAILKKLAKEAPEATTGIHAYHASPYDFDRFSLDHLGKGFGANRFGRGIYASEDPKVSGLGGEYWRGFVQDMKSQPERTALYMLQDAKFDKDLAIKELMERRAKEIERANDPNAEFPYQFGKSLDQSLAGYDKIIDVLSRKEGLPGPKVYELNINANPEHMLNWDTTIRSQNPLIQEIAREKAGKLGFLTENDMPSYNANADEVSSLLGIPRNYENEPRIVEDITGLELHRGLQKHYGAGNDAQAQGYVADELKEAGIPGIRYLGSSSRGMSDFVTFDPSIIDITNKYASGGRIAKGGAGAVVGDALRTAKEFLFPEAAQAAGVTAKQAGKGFSDVVRPYEQWGYKYEELPGKIPTKSFDPNVLKPGDVFVPLFGDRTSAGQKILEIGGNPLAEPVVTEGGPHYMLNPKGQIWASGQSIISGIANKAEKALQASEKLGHKDPTAYGVYVPMGKQSGDFSTHTADAILGLLPGSKITKKSAKEFDQTLQGILADFPGLNSPDLRQYLMEPGAGNRRIEFSQTMDAKNWREAGFPDVGAARMATTDQNLLFTPNYHGGYMIGKIDRANPVNKIPALEHGSYPVALMGEYVGSLPTNIHKDFIFPDWTSYYDSVMNPKKINYTQAKYKSYNNAMAYQPVGPRSIEALQKAIEEAQALKANGGSVEQDADIDAALMTARVKKGGGGGFSKLLGEAFYTLTGKPEREALQELTPAGSGYVSVPGKPTNVNIPLIGNVEAKPIRAIEDAAANYMKKIGRPGEHVVEQFPKIDKDRAAKVAVAYDEMLHNPNDPAVRRSYEAMIDETIAQYNALKDLDLDIRFNPPGFDPYAKTPSMGYADLAENRRLWVFPTEQGYGSSDINSILDPDNNPLLKRVGSIGDFQNATANDLFRVVHDVYGHLAPGNPFFRAPGEERAWLQHSRMYSPEALPAMSSETRGQNSWVNFGPYAEHNAKASGADTIYADQKTGLLPPWAYEKAAGGSVNDAEINAAMMIAQRDHKAGGGSEYGALPELPYDKPITPFATPEMIERGKYLRGKDDTDALLASSYGNNSIRDMAAADNQNQYIQDVMGEPASGTLTSHFYTPSEYIRAALPEIGKQNFDIGREGVNLFTGAPDLIDADATALATGENPSIGQMAEMAFNTAPGLFLTPLGIAGKTAYKYGAPIAKKYSLPVAAGLGLAGATATPSEAEAGIFGEAAKKLIGEEGLNLAKKMYAEGAPMSEIEAATKWYAPPRDIFRFKDGDYEVVKNASIGDWRTYINPKNVKFAEREISNVPKPLRSVMEWPELDVIEPNALDNINIVQYSRGTDGAYFNPRQLEIGVGNVNSPFYRGSGGDPYQTSVMHEIQHFIQGRGGFPSGTNIETAKKDYARRARELKLKDIAQEIKNGDLGDAFYFAHPGEIEARNAEYRFANPDLRGLPIASTEDIPVKLGNWSFDAPKEDLLAVRDWWASPEAAEFIKGNFTLAKDRP